MTFEPKILLYSAPADEEIKKKRERKLFFDSERHMLLYLLAISQRIVMTIRIAVSFICAFLSYNVTMNYIYITCERN